MQFRLTDEKDSLCLFWVFIEGMRFRLTSTQTNTTLTFSMNIFWSSDISQRSGELVSETFATVSSWS